MIDRNKPTEEVTLHAGGGGKFSLLLVVSGMLQCCMKHRIPLEIWLAWQFQRPITLMQAFLLCMLQFLFILD